MNDLRTHLRFGLLMSALALCSVPNGAAAQEACETNDDCAHGFTCEEVGGECPAIDCAEGSDCDLPECESTLGCVPARDCDADADCAEGWKCATEEHTQCSGGAAANLPCAEGEDCDKPEPTEPTECETKEVSFCAPPWVLPCEEAADCGPGFECVELIAMSCSGSSGSAGDPRPSDGDGDFAPPPDEGAPLPECTSEPTGEYHCELLETACETDDDCAAGLTCQQNPLDAVCSSASSGDSAGSGGGDNPGTPEERRATCEMTEPTYICAPPSYSGGYGYGYDLGAGRDEEGASTSDPDSGNSGEPDTSGESPAAPVDADGEAALGEDDATGDMTGESSGCSAMGSSRTSSSMLVMALAVLGLAIRRRSLRA